MRRFIVLAAAVLLVLAMVPITSATTTTTTTKHVDGTVKVHEPYYGGREWLARFEVRTTPSGDVQFGYLHLYGITATNTAGGNNAGSIHEFSVNHVNYYRTETGQSGATLYMEECIISKPESEPVPPSQCFPSNYMVSDGAAVGRTDTFLGNAGWTVESGNISIYTTSGQNSQ